MAIKWNEVTPLSKTLSLIVFVIIFPYITFVIGKEYGALHATPSLETVEVVKEVHIPSPVEKTENIDSRITLLNTVYTGKIVDTEYGKAGGTQKGIESGSSEKMTTVIIAGVHGVASNEEWILTQSSTCNAHPCGAKLGGVIYATENGKLVIKKVQREMETLGEFGNINTPKSVWIGKNIPAFQIENMAGGMGSFSGSLILYSVVNGEFKKILDIPQAFESNSGSGYEKTHEYKTTLTFTPVSDSNYYDITAETKGTQEVSGRIVPINETKEYSFDGAKYVLR